MSQWYYSRGGMTHGPFSEEEMQDRVTRKLLLETDLIWPEGRSPRDAAPVAVVFETAPSSAASTPIPDWLADVAATQSTGPAPGPLLSHEAPEWLEDLRLWVGLELYTPGATTLENAPPHTGAIPEWLEGWLTPEKPEGSHRHSTGSAPAAPSVPPAEHIAPPMKPAVTPPPASPVSIPGASPARPPSRQAPPVSPPQVETQVPPAAPAPMVAPPVAKTTAFAGTRPVAETRADPRVEEMRQASGFDPETGQILDAAKFRKWQQQQAHPITSSQPAVSNASLLEVFRKARLAVETWVDDEANRACIMQADIEDIKRRAEIQMLLREYANFGQAMQEKLSRHLEFMVENRRKYYQAVEARAT
jgi:hypothetical protein